MVLWYIGSIMLFLENLGVWSLICNPKACMAPFTHFATKLPHRLHLLRTFVDAKVKWVRDPYLDTAVQKEKNLKSLLSLKTLILSQPSKTLPISTASSLKPILNLPTTATKFIKNYPSVFKHCQPPKPLSLPHVTLTPQALALHREETLVLNSPNYRKDAAERLTKFLMLTRAKKLPLMIIDKFKFDLGLPHNFILNLLPDFPEYFQICTMDHTDSNGRQVFGLELISWRDDLAVSAMERKAMEENFGCRRGMPISYSMNFPRGFDLEKKVKDWVEEWQKLPYISPYEDAFHLSPISDQSEKWTVGVLHELLYLLVSKKTERENVFCLGDYLGFGMRFKKALVHHPGIFYISNKIRTQTVVLREAYKKDFLVEKNLLMGMRYRYIHLMNNRMKQRKPIRVRVDGRKKQVSFSSTMGGEREENKVRGEESEVEPNGSSDYSGFGSSDDEGIGIIE